MPGLQFYKFGFLPTKKNMFSLLVKSSLVKLDSCTAILLPTVNVLCSHCKSVRLGKSVKATFTCPHQKSTFVIFPTSPVSATAAGKV